VITQKYVVAWQDDPQEFGRRVQTEARRRGLATAQDVFVVADGGVWIWNVQQDRFGQAKGMLDFYHTSEHLWAVARQTPVHHDDQRKGLGFASGQLDRRRLQGFPRQTPLHLRLGPLAHSPHIAPPKVDGCSWLD
jgi:hypothetical protein